MIKVKTKIPSGSLTLLTKPNAAGECAVYLRYYLGSRYEENYRKAKSKYFGLYFTDGIIEIKVLSSVAEFVKEGTRLKHCVYTNDYYKRSSSLILTARLKSDPTIPVETIELSLNTFEIIQSRGYKNSPSPYHDSIISLMKSGIPQIRSIAA